MGLYWVERGTAQRKLNFIENKVKRARLAILTMVSLCLSVLGAQAHAANIQAQATLDSSGGLVGPLNTIGDDLCPTSSTPGCDFSAADNVVRTHDAIGYKLSLRVDPPGDDVYVKLKLKPGAIWSEIPGFCDPYNSTLSGDGTALKPSELNCDLGFRSAWAGDFTFPAKVMGTNPNNTMVGISNVEFGGANSTPVHPTTPPDLRVTAMPRLDLKIVRYTTAAKTISGVTGIDNSYSFHLGLWDHDRNGNPHDDPNPLLGNEQITGPVTFTNDMSGISPNSYVWECYLPGSSSYPWTTYNITNPDRSVVRAGSTSCSNKGSSATGSVDVTVSGANLSFDHVPTKYRSGSSLPGDFSIASFGMIRIFTPASDISNAGGSLGITNTFTGLNATSISGQSNFFGLGEDTSNNSYSQTLKSRPGSFSHTMRCFISGSTAPSWCDPSTWWGPPTNAGTVGGGDGVVTPEQSFITYTYYRNNSFIPDSYAEVCAVFDTDLYDVTPYSGTKVARCHGSCGTLGTDYIIEYSASYTSTSWKSQRPTPSGAVPDECSAPASEWHSSLSAAQALGPITKTRMRRLKPLAAGSAFAMATNLKAKTATGLTAYPNSTLMRTWGSVKAETTSTSYRNCVYNQATATTPHSRYSCGDRLALVRALARIAKTTLPGDRVNSVEVGSTVEFQLAPTFTSVGSGISDDLSVIDQLPVGAEYVSGSARQNGISFAPVVTGSPTMGETLKWTLPGQAVNTAIAPITFLMRVPLSMVNGKVLHNTAIVESMMDSSSAAQRSDTRSVTVTAPSSLLMHKQLTSGIVNPGGDLKFKLSYDNRTNVALSDVNVIDILPYNGDGRLPASQFQGSLGLKSVSPQSTNITIYVTKDTPATLQSNPSHADNDLSNGQTRWCALSSSFSINPGATPTIGGSSSLCPQNNTQVTAIRSIDHDPLPSNQFRDLNITLSTQGNYGSNIYTNQARAYANGVSFSPFSPYSSVTIQGQGELQAEKTVAMWDPNNEGRYAVPGNEVLYKISIENSGDGPIDNNSIFLVDKFPPELEFWNGSLSGGGPVVMQAVAAPNMGLDPSTDIAFSSATTKPTDFNQCQSRPIDQEFKDDITFVCIRPTGTLGAGTPSPTLHFSMKARIR